MDREEWVPVIKVAKAVRGLWSQGASEYVNEVIYLGVKLEITG